MSHGIQTTHSVGLSDGGQRWADSCELRLPRLLWIMIVYRKVLWRDDDFRSGSLPVDGHAHGSTRDSKWSGNRLGDDETNDRQDQEKRQDSRSVLALFPLLRRWLVSRTVWIGGFSIFSCPYWHSRDLGPTSRWKAHYGARLINNHYLHPREELEVTSERFLRRTKQGELRNLHSSSLTFEFQPGCHISYIPKKPLDHASRDRAEGGW